MVSFQKDLGDLFNKLKFSKISSNFRNHLKEDIKSRLYRSQKSFFVFADKTSNRYQIKKDEYSKLTTDAITSATKRFPTKLATKLIQMKRK